MLCDCVHVPGSPARICPALRRPHYCGTGGRQEAHGTSGDGTSATPTHGKGCGVEFHGREAAHQRHGSVHVRIRLLGHLVMPCLHRRAQHGSVSCRGEWAGKRGVATVPQTCTARLSVFPGRVGWEARGGDCAALRPVSDDIGQPPRRSPSSTVHPAGFDGWRPHTILSHDSITTHRSGRTATRGACRCTWRLPEYSAACQG